MSRDAMWRRSKREEIDTLEGVPRQSSG